MIHHVVQLNEKLVYLVTKKPVHLGTEKPSQKGNETGLVITISWVTDQKSGRKFMYFAFL